MRKIDLVGKVFSRLTVLREDGKTNTGIIKWMCRCECGNYVSVIGNNLRRLHTTSCGCFKFEQITKANKIHGMTHTKEYDSWVNMRRRCEDKTNKNYHSYGGRGITIAKEWQLFSKFIDDMGFCPKGFTLDRINNNGNYELLNCRWASRLQQANNTRRNTIFEFKGETKTAAEWIKISGLKSSTFWQRVYTLNWSFEKAITTPSGKYKRK